MIEHKLPVAQLDWDKVIDIENRREMFWSDYLIDNTRTTARLTVNKPVRLDTPIRMDAPWDGNSISYPQILPMEDGSYRMYYLTGSFAGGTFTGYTEMLFCMLESNDGIEWTRPSLGVVEWNGSTDNNIVLKESKENVLDNFFIFRDENPACPADELYKALTLIENPDVPFPGCRELWFWISPDGIRFKNGWKMTDGTVPNGGIFDSVNTGYWDEKKEKYVAYVRGLHDGPGRGTANGLRDIRYIESDDFRNWTNPVILNYGDSDDVELYTNQISRYYRAPHILTGFPVRYTERHWWVKSNDFIGGEKNLAMRKSRAEKLERVGFVVTDGLFMSSHDGLNWHRFDEAMFPPEAEHTCNWIYGDGYTAYGMIETPRAYPHTTKELSMYMLNGKHETDKCCLYRHVIRLDGFASYRADYEQKVVCTKPLMFEGDTLTLNFKTSARGYIFVRVLDYYGKPFEGFQSYEIFGDAYDRPVLFDSGAELSKLKGKPIRLEFLMSDADIYSMKFE